jgi:hypothetical protein
MIIKSIKDSEREIILTESEVKNRKFYNIIKFENDVPVNYQCVADLESADTIFNVFAGLEPMYDGVL